MFDIDFDSISDQVASATADADQAQAQIDECRRSFPSDQTLQLELDRQQTELDEKRERIRIIKMIANLVYKPEKYLQGEES